MNYNADGGKRDEWTVCYAGRELAKGALTRKHFHEDRLKWWRVQYEAVMAQIKDTGISVSEPVAMKYGGSLSNNTGYGPQVQVESNLQTKLTECHTKIQAHDERIKEYEGWVQMLEANQSQTFQLSIRDWLFFFQKG